MLVVSEDRVGGEDDRRPAGGQVGEGIGCAGRFVDRGAREERRKEGRIAWRGEE